MKNRDRTAVVIGAGLGGLGVAMSLAARGWRVTVCERSAGPGGKMNRWAQAGYVFDTGPSLITMPWVFERFFAACGMDIREHVRWMRVEPMAAYRFADGTHFLHTGDLPAWLRTLREIEPRDVSGFLRFMALGERLFDISQSTFFANSPFERPDPRSIAVLPRLPVRWAWGIYHKTIAHFFRSPYLQQMFDRYITYVGSSPYLAPATLSVIPFIEYVFGAWHVEGGLYRVIEAMCRWLNEHGVGIRMGSAVTRIAHQNGRVSGVELQTGEFIPARVVVMNGDASRTSAMLGIGGGHLAPERRSLSGFVMLVAVRQSMDARPHHSVFFSPDYAKEFRELFVERRFPDDPTVYVNMPTRTDRSMAPPGGEVVFIMANAPADEQAWDDNMVKMARDRVFSRLRAGGFPDFSQHILAEKVITPRDFAERFDMPGGAIYGQVSHGWRGAFLRPPNRDRQLRGLYYVGGSTHPGGGTPTVLLSAEITTRLIAHYEE